MTDIDTNVSNYTLSELLTIVGIDNESVNSDVLGYKELNLNPTTTGEVTLTKNLTNNQQGVLVQQFITPELGFSIIPGGPQRFIIHYLLPAANADVEGYVEIQLADSLGNLIGPVITSNVNLLPYVDPINSGELLLDIVIPTTSISPTNRMVARLYLNNLDSTSRSVVFYTEGNANYSYVITSVGQIAGTSGTSGTSGTDGTSGTSGVSPFIVSVVPNPGNETIDITFDSDGISTVVQVPYGTSGTSGTDGTDGSSGTSGTNGTSGTSVIVQNKANITLPQSGFTLSGGFWEYTRTDGDVTSSSVVDYTPYNAYISIVIDAEFLPYILASASTATFYSNFQPTSDVVGQLVIFN
jgi:hypothetical protein